MKKLIKILTLILLFSCNDNTQTTEEELPNELSLDWILLRKNTDNPIYIENCDGYDVGIVNGYCSCGWSDFGCGDCKLTTYKWEEIESCEGYNVCEYSIPLWNNLNNNECCVEINPTNIYNIGGDCHYYDNCSFFLHQQHPIYEYKLYWNDDLYFCSDGVQNFSYCSQITEDEIDIFISSIFPQYLTNNCQSDDCNYEYYFNPNCDELIDTTLTIGNKSVSIKNMGWFDRLNNQKGYITYLRNEQYLQTNGNDIDLSVWEVVDYQIKE